MHQIQNAPAILATASSAQVEAFRRSIYAAAARGEVDTDQLAQLDFLANERSDALRAFRSGTQPALPLPEAHGAPAAPTGPNGPRWLHKARSGRSSPFSTGRRPPKSPDLERSARRRRRVARGNPVPDSLSFHFTEHGIAILEIVARAHLEAGRCTMTVGEIAARAGVSVSTVRRTMAQAEALSLLGIERRERPGAPNLPNVVRVTSGEWRTWLATRPKRLRPEGEGISSGGRVSGCEPTEDQDTTFPRKSSERSRRRAVRRDEGPPDRVSRTR